MNVEAITKRFSEIAAERLEWLWPGRIPKGKLTLLVSEPGLGKSIFTMDVAARVSTGRPWPDATSTLQREPGSAIIVSAEDDVADTIRVRLEAAGADLGRVLVLEALKCDDLRCDLFNARLFYAGLRTAIDKHADVKLVIADPITAYCGGQNENSNSEVREFLTPLVDLAAKTGVTVVGVSHLNKKTEQAASCRTLGSVAWYATPRAVWLLAKDPHDKDSRLLLPLKANLGKSADGLAFKFKDVEVQTTGGAVMSVACDFQPGKVDLTPDEVLAPKNGPRKPREKAEAWLEAQLAAGPVPSETVYSKAKEVGIAEKTLERAKKELGVESSIVVAADGSRKSYWKMANPP
jgi:archaellum biogenesis ATPase FlaH